VTAFIHTNGLTGIDVVGSSMGARLVLELARRGGMVGGVVALDPGGFWQGSQRHAFYKHWDAPAETTRLILSALAPRGSPAEQDLALRAAG
jgi:pimeloyl-ACP methyl ester carboxylesterase